MAGVGPIGAGADNVAFTLGVSMTAASETALIYAEVPIWGILLGLALGLEWPSCWGIVGICLAFLGVGVEMWFFYRERLAGRHEGPALCGTSPSWREERIARAHNLYAGL